MAKSHERWISELCILSILSSRDAYGYEITKDSNIMMSGSAVYPILRRLEDQRLLTAYTQLNNSRMRKFYHITEEGLKSLEERKNDRTMFRDNINALP